MSTVNRITYSVRRDRETGEWLTIRRSAEPSVIIARSATRREALEVAWIDPFTMPKPKPRRLLLPVTAPIRKEMT